MTPRELILKNYSCGRSLDSQNQEPFVTFQLIFRAFSLLSLVSETSFGWLTKTLTITLWLTAVGFTVLSSFDPVTATCSSLYCSPNLCCVSIVSSAFFYHFCRNIIGAQTRDSFFVVWCYLFFPFLFNCLCLSAIFFLVQARWSVAYLEASGYYQFGL